MSAYINEMFSLELCVDIHQKLVDHFLELVVLDHKSVSIKVYARNPFGQNSMGCKVELRYFQVVTIFTERNVGFHLQNASYYHNVEG